MSYSSLFCILLVVKCRAQLPYDDEESIIRQELGLYRNLDEVLNVFSRDPNPLAKQIMEAFHTECLYVEDPLLPEGPRKPFIVIEGNHRASKESIGIKLANLLDGRYIGQIAPCLRRFITRVKTADPLRRPLQFLSLYATAFDARVQMTLNRAVVVNSYWIEQLSFTVTRSFHVGALPPISANIFQYPEDLMRPDIHIFIDFSESLYTTTPAPHVPATGTKIYHLFNVRPTVDLRKRKLQLYQHLQSKFPILIHQLQKTSNRVTAVQLLSKIRANLSNTRDFDMTMNFDYR